MIRRALITGITGQDGSYLAELLLSKGYEVHGLMRRCAARDLWRLREILGSLRLHEGDLLDGGSLARLVRRVRPDEVYNLAAQSHVGASFEEPEHTGDATGLGAVRLLEAVRQSHRDARVYQASSSEMFGDAPPPQSESTPHRPRSPYAAAKSYAHQMVGLYRDAYGMHASCGVLFNHESPRRGQEFVTRKITLAAARIKAGIQDRLLLGNLEARRDWGYAPDYVEAMWLMLQRPEPGDYVVATGETHTVREFVEEVFAHCGLDWRERVAQDPALLRPAEVPALLGDAARAREVLGWRPSVKFKQLARIMAEADVALVAGRAGS